MRAMPAHLSESSDRHPVFEAARSDHPPLFRERPIGVV